MAALSTFLLLSCLSFVIRNANSDLQVPGNCDFITYCARLRKYEINPSGSHPGICPDPNICGREVEVYKRRKQIQNSNALSNDRKSTDSSPKGGKIDSVESTTVEGEGGRERERVDESLPGSCKDLAHCGRVPQRNSRPIEPEDPKNDAFPGTCKDLLHCGRSPQRHSRPPATSAPSDALPGANRFPQRGGASMNPKPKPKT